MKNYFKLSLQLHFNMFYTCGFLTKNLPEYVINEKSASMF